MLDKIVNTNKKKIGLSAFAFIIYCFYYISGYSSQGHNYIIFALFALWTLLAVVEDVNAFSKALSSKSVLWLSLFLVFYIMTSFMLSDLVYILEYVAVYLFLYGVYIQYRYYLVRNRTKEIGFICKMIILAFIIFAVMAIQFYTINPSAARTLAADFYAFDNIAIGGGYSIAFGSALLVVYLFELLLRENIIKKKMLILVLIILFSVLVIKTESTTTIIAMVVGLVYGWIRKIYYGNDIHKNKHNIYKKLIAIGIIILLTVLILVNISAIGEWIMNITSSSVNDNVVARRFNKIAEKLYYFGSGGSSDNYVDERFGTVVMSFNTFLKNPLIGVGYQCGNVFSNLGKVGVGTHSELTDTFAQFGVIGGGFWLAYLLSSLRSCGRFSKIKGYYLTLVILLVFNPFKAFHGYIVLFFLIPAINYLIMKNKEMNLYEQR